MQNQTLTELRRLEKQLYAYGYAQALMSCDEATAAPPCSEAGRAEAAEVLSRAAFDLLVNDDTAALLRGRRRGRRRRPHGRRSPGTAAPL